MPSQFFDSDGWEGVLDTIYGPDRDNPRRRAAGETVAERVAQAERVGRAVGERQESQDA